MSSEAETRISQALADRSTSLDLSSIGLVSVPESIEELTSLTELRLGHNQLTEVPESISQLTGLTEIHLGHNWLKVVPDSIGELTNLTHLSLNDNHLREVPDSIGELSSLTRLHLGHNRLREVPDSIGELSSLTRLYLVGNQLSAVPDSIWGLTKLASLYVGHNQLTAVPDSIGQLTDLTRLYLNNNQLTAVPDSIGKLTNLTQLHFQDNQLTAVPDSISQLTNLTQLHFQSNHLTAVPDSISQLTNLTQLYLDGNQLTAVPESISQLTGLTHLSLHDNPLPEEFLAAVESDGVQGLRDWFDGRPVVEQPTPEDPPRARVAFAEGASMAEIATLKRRPLDDEGRTALKRAYEPVFDQAHDLLSSGAFDHDQAIVERVDDALRGLRVQLWPLDGAELKSPDRAYSFVKELSGYITQQRRTQLDSTDPERDALDQADALLEAVSFDGTQRDIATATNLGDRLAEAIDWDQEPAWLADEEAFENYLEQLEDRMSPSTYLAIQVDAQNRFTDAGSITAAMYVDAKERWLELSVWAVNRSAEAVANAIGWVKTPHPKAQQFLHRYVPATAGSGAAFSIVGNIFGVAATGGVIGLIVGFITAILAYGYGPAEPGEE